MRAAPTVCEPPLRELDLRVRRLLRLLREGLQREEHLAATALGREEETERLSLAIRSNLVDLAPEMPRRRKSRLPHILHRRDYAAHERAVRASFPEVAGELRSILGAKLCAYLGSVKETRAVHEWADGGREPSEQTSAIASRKAGYFRTPNEPERNAIGSTLPLKHFIELVIGASLAGEAPWSNLKALAIVAAWGAAGAVLAARRFTWEPKER